MRIQKIICVKTEIICACVERTGNFLTSLGTMCSVREKRFADIFQMRKKKKKRGKNKIKRI